MVISPIKKYLSKEELKKVAETIADAERSTSGEIRVSIRHKRGWNEGKYSLHEIALREFHRLGMHNTKDRTGVLIFLLLSERKFHILGDEGIDRKIGEGMWDGIAAGMSSHFKEGKFSHGITHAVETVGRELQKHFPREAGDRDELPNDVVEG